MPLDVNISLCYKKYLILLQITLLYVFEVYRTKRSKTFAESIILLLYILNYYNDCKLLR